MKKLIILLLLCLPIVVGAQLKETYPKIGMMEIGGNRRESNPDYRQTQSKADILILGMWHKFRVNDDVSGISMGVGDVVRDIKRRADAVNHPILIAKYTNFMESTGEGESATKIESEVGPRGSDWWVYDADTGERVSTFKNNYNINITDHTTPDENGDRYPEWKAVKYYENFYRDIPELNLWFIDNWFYRPRTNRADWDGNGTNDSKNSAQVRHDYQIGLLRALTRIKELQPNIHVIGNVDGEPGVGGALSEPAYSGKLGGFMEGAIGVNYSIETWSTWEKMMLNWHTLANNSKDELAIFGVQGEADDYQLMRYGLTSALMNNGYYNFTSYDRQYRDALWFDEYDVNLGKAISLPQYRPWKEGVYRRDFEYGIVLVNPKGNNFKTITIESGYKHFLGTQDSIMNNGQKVTEVTLNTRDGVILLKNTRNISLPNSPVVKDLSNE